MTVNMQPTGLWNRYIAVAIAFRRFLARKSGSASAAATSILKTLQTGRMMSVLAGMNDQQLAQIGISRSDIPRYAETLTSDRRRAGLAIRRD